MEEKSYKKILVCNISHKLLIDAKPLGIRFDKIVNSHTMGNI